MNDSVAWLEESDLHNKKWRDTFCCVRCGSDNYRVVNKGLGRRCKKCDREESLYKYTAFERVKIPFDVIQKLIIELMEAVHQLYSDNIIISRTGKRMSIQDYMARNDEWEAERYRKTKDLEEQKKPHKAFKQVNTNKTIEEAISKWLPSVRHLSKLTGVEENSITLLLNKVSSRITIADKESNSSNGLETLVYFCQTHENNAYHTLMNLMFLPLIGNWESGKCTSYPNLYLSESNGEWSIWSQKENHAYREEIEYGSEDWKEFFCERWNESK